MMLGWTLIFMDKRRINTVTPSSGLWRGECRLLKYCHAFGIYLQNRKVCTSISIKNLSNRYFSAMPPRTYFYSFFRMILMRTDYEIIFTFALSKTGINNRAYFD
jgi:hypothetical protein